LGPRGFLEAYRGGKTGAIGNIVACFKRDQVRINPIHRVVIAGLGPATPINGARPCHLIGVAGTSPAMTRENERRGG